jgi:hypothetical protein|tara:strand:+ start:1582 stop:1839 length:258 start_codon:yes stop_codon:yes gene_type:complete
MRDNYKDSTSDLHIDDVCDSILVTETSMNELFELVIKPMLPKLTSEDTKMLGIIGVSLRLVSKKAKAYEEIFECGQQSLPENYKN